MNQLTKIIAQLSTEDLQLLNKNLQTGLLQTLVQNHIHDKQKKRICPVCGAKTSKEQGIRLEFGPKDLRQFAVFDGPDCLQFFIAKHFKNGQGEQ